MLGLSGHAFDWLQPEELLRMMTAEFGIKALDYWEWNSRDLSTAQYVRLLERYDVQVYCVNVLSTRGRLGVSAERETGRAAMLAGIAEAVALGAPYVQFYTGVMDRPEFLTVVKCLAEELRPILDVAVRDGITLLIENNLDQRGEDLHGMNPARRPELNLALLEEVDSPNLRLCYDPANYYAVGTEAFPYAYDLLQPFIENVHVKDCVRYSPLLHTSPAHSDQKLLKDVLEGPFLPVAVGQGAINWDGILQRLAADRYSGWITFDPFSSPGPLRDLCTRSLSYLKPRLGQQPQPTA